MAVTSYLELLDEALNHPDFDNPLGKAIKAVFDIAEYMGWYALFVSAISGVTSAVSNHRRKP